MVHINNKPLRLTELITWKCCKTEEPDKDVLLGRAVQCVYSAGVCQSLSARALEGEHLGCSRKFQAIGMFVKPWREVQLYMLQVGLVN